MHGQSLVMHVPDPCIDNSGMSVRTRVQRTVRLSIISLEASSVRLVHPSSNALCRRLQTSRMKSVRFQHGRGYQAAQLARALATTRENEHGHQRTWHAGGGGSVMRLLQGRQVGGLLRSGARSADRHGVAHTDRDEHHVRGEIFPNEAKHLCNALSQPIFSVLSRCMSDRRRNRSDSFNQAPRAQV